MNYGLILNDSPNNFEELQDAAGDLDYQALKKNFKNPELRNLSAGDKESLWHELVMLIHDGCITCKDDTRAVDCLKLLEKRGIPFYYQRDFNSQTRREDNYPNMFKYDYMYGDLILNSDDLVDEDEAPLDKPINLENLGPIPRKYNKKSIYNTVKFLLTHGGKYNWVSNADQVILEKWGIMNWEDFTKFSIAGDSYLKAVEKGEKPDEIQIEKWVRNAERGLVAVPLLDRANLEELKKDKDEKIKQLQLQIEEVKREYDKNFKDYIKDMNMKTKVYRELSQGTPERDTKASELKAKMRERDTSGSKKTLRAFLKEKSGKKVSGKKAPRSSTKKQSVHE